MTIEAVLPPGPVGVKVRFKLQLVIGAMGRAVQVLEFKVKSPATRMSLITRGLAPTLDRVTIMGALVVFTVRFPKFAAAGATEAAAVVTPVPTSGTIRGVLGSLVVMTIEAESTPVTVGVKATFIVQLVIGAMG
jgi:hypothetical protein